MPPTPPAPPRIDRPVADPRDAREKALVLAHRAGDSAALGELLRGYQDRVFGVCMRMTQDYDLAADLAQEAMVKIIRGLDRFDGRSKLSTWVIRVTINVCLTDRRRSRLRRHASLDAPLQGRHEGDSERSGGFGDSLAEERERGPGERIEISQARRSLYEAMGRIDPAQRAILILRDIQELDYKQIADVLDIPEGTVKSRLFRARSALREQLLALEQR